MRMVSLPACFLLCASGDLNAERISDIRNTKHNLSISGPGPVRATSESEVCVFCHTPHGASDIPAAPLWNRALSGATYTPYTSTSIDAQDTTAEPGGSSKLCLSCHDGTLAIGAVNVANGQANANISLQGTAAGGTIPEGSGALSGFTRRIGVDLTNDHPISFTYDSALALADGELRDPSIESHIATRASGQNPKPVVPLESDRLECVSCHDPHIRDTDISKNIKFLRLNRFQEGPPGSAFSGINDIVCLACHDKLGQRWADSAHADPAVADETYKTAPADLREFPAGIAVWQASCLNCHDTHTVQGSRRLLREGSDALGGPTQPRLGGAAAIESTCYQCHTNDASSVLNFSLEVPNIEDDFVLARHMPITSLDQPAGVEVHDISDADFSEDPLFLGKGDLNNRHAECTDCHNPHRLQRNTLFNGNGSNLTGTHDHGASHSNIASGVLRGTTGVEPVYGSASFHDLPLSYTLKRGDGGDGASNLAISPWVTREYQICLKCHSDYGYDDNNLYPVGDRPALGDSIGTTTPGTNGLTQYTNQAREFQAPVAHQGFGSPGDSGADFDYLSNNQRSWHPVIAATGRDGLQRNQGDEDISSNWVPPFDDEVGGQTMYCSDCHGSGTAPGTVVPDGGANGRPWGPHGSNHNFILKGDWSADTGTGRPQDLCFKCHDYDVYAGGDRSVDSGFGRGDNLHAEHFERITGNRVKCMWCHVAVPHGWKNKGLLVNLNDVGPEAGLPPGTEVPIQTNAEVYNQEPYYFNAKLKVINFAQSGDWRPDNCGSASSNPDVGRDWMGAVCQNPP
ncbi:MAG: multiheme c-type cytochrome [Candidatus Thiodiazotropha endolucinida]